jgi:hypothetical protein
MKICTVCPHQNDCLNTGACLDELNAPRVAANQFPERMTPVQANRFMAALHEGRTLRRICGGGSLGPAIASASKFRKHCSLYPEWGAEAERLAKKNQHAAYLVTTTINFDLARKRSAESRKNSETCSNGHVRTLQSTFYVRSRNNGLVRRCKECCKNARLARMPTAEEVRGMVAALHHGGTLTSTLPGHQQATMRNFIRKNPKIGDRLRRLSKRNGIEHQKEAWRSRRQFATSSLTRNNGVDAYEAVRLATAHVPADERDDVMSRMFVAVAEGRLRLSETSSRVGEFVRAHRSRPRVLGDYSLDKPLGDGSTMTWLDTKTEADRLWA